jgi:signal transduction histidine kinase
VKREEDVAALVEEAVDSVQGGGIVEADIPEGLTVMTDRNMLLTCLRNLLDNALKVTPVGGKVRLKARAGSIVITDEGPGLREGDKAWGHGLGLVITRELLDKMGAALHMQNRPEGGLEITIDL